MENIYIQRRFFDDMMDLSSKKGLMNRAETRLYVE
jgi:hypothetical protein